MVGVIVVDSELAHCVLLPLVRGSKPTRTALSNSGTYILQV